MNTLLSAKSAQRTEDLSASDLSVLTGLLHLDQDDVADANWHQKQRELIRLCPPTLLQPKSLIARLSTRLRHSSTHNAILCSTHKRLSAPLIRQLFLRIVAEISHRLRRLQAHRESLTPAVLGAVRRLEVLNSLWMDFDLYCTSFKVMPSEPSYERVHSGCEACILAHVSGNEAMLHDLRAAILSRNNPTRIEPRLLIVIDNWISWHAGGRKAIFASSELLAQEMRNERQRVKIESRRAKQQSRLAELKLHERDLRHVSAAGRSSLSAGLLNDQMIRDGSAAVMSRRTMGRSYQTPVSSISGSNRRAIRHSNGFMTPANSRTDDRAPLLSRVSTATAARQLPRAIEDTTQAHNDDDHYSSHDDDSPVTTGASSNEHEQIYQYYSNLVSSSNIADSDRNTSVVPAAHREASMTPDLLHEMLQAQSSTKTNVGTSPYKLPTCETVTDVATYTDSTSGTTGAISAAGSDTWSDEVFVEETPVVASTAHQRPSGPSKKWTADQQAQETMASREMKESSPAELRRARMFPSHIPIRHASRAAEEQAKAYAALVGRRQSTDSDVHGSRCSRGGRDEIRGGGYRRGDYRRNGTESSRGPATFPASSPYVQERIPKYGEDTQS